MSDGKRSFLDPHALKRDEKTGMSKVDLPNSEDYRLLEALGTPKVFYALKANQYFKNPECTKIMSDEEVTALGLPIPIEIETARRKLTKELLDTQQDVDFMSICRATAPRSIKSPDNIDKRLITNDPIDRMINRINRSTLGK